ncbi:NAD(P)-binding domain-containing protein [Streptomonospora salina]|uniref:Putative dinucleotide-binding enzyme n=1 Tax=Streptomonospora salina TaxID=104205 RepID=A0A841E7Z7_9ACTN|nr:NAD(P)-binding domain-containing protein [Streptomonospora salina]MBB6000077.1 putative dinucleotide-binding enzyme [Streptomonospora salina]
MRWSRLARKFGAARHDVAAANSRDPCTISAEVLEFGARAVTATDAVQDKDTIVLSIPFSRIPRHRTNPYSTRPW